MPATPPDHPMRYVVPWGGAVLSSFAYSTFCTLDSFAGRLPGAHALCPPPSPRVPTPRQPLVLSLRASRSWDSIHNVEDVSNLWICYPLGVRKHHQRE